MTNFIRHGALQLPLPDGWYDASQVVAVGPDDGGFRPNIVVSLEPTPAGEPLEQFAARSLAAVRQATQEFALGGERSATFGPHKGVLREYAFSLQGNRLAQLQFLLVKDQVGYTFTYTQRPEKMAQTRSVAENFFASVHLDSKSPAAPAAQAPAAKGGSKIDSLW